MGREYDQFSELAALWKSRGSTRKPVNAATTDRFCELCLIAARRQQVDFPILATIAVPDANGVERWLCRIHADKALEQRRKRLANEQQKTV